jgi:hypothetical protein
VDISTFDDLLAASRQQPQPQRLLLVFARAELPEDCTPLERERFRGGNGGALVPAMCVDKTAQELTSFDALNEEAKQFCADWRFVFVGALAGKAGAEPTSADAEKPLQRMVEGIKAGDLANLIPFDRQGCAVQLSR